MEYNQIHDRYELGLGLYFSLTNKHVEHKGKIFCNSNIPVISYKALKAQDFEGAILEVLNIISTEVFVLNMNVQELREYMEQNNIKNKKVLVA